MAICRHFGPQSAAGRRPQLKTPAGFRRLHSRQDWRLPITSDSRYREPMLWSCQNTVRVTVLRKLRNWQGRPLSERLWFMPAFLTLGLVRLVQSLVPFRRIAPWLGTDLRTAAYVPLASHLQMQRARHIGRAIAMAARYTPWDSQCLVQAIAARLLLRTQRLPSVLLLGVATDDQQKLRAHAWVCCGAVAVTGGTDTGAYRVVGTFVSRLAHLSCCPDRDAAH